MYELETSVLQKYRIKNYLVKTPDTEIENEILKGLQSEQKHISSKYFYDDKGSELFEEITHLEEYYPTRIEKSILKRISKDLFANLCNVDIVELGSGDCSKISILLQEVALLNQETITYIPVDVSKSAVEKSADLLTDRFPSINIEPVVADFLKQFEYLRRNNPVIVCFLGSTIGNLYRSQSIKFVNNIAAYLKQGDKLLLGMDMVKDIDVLENAYNDQKGITAAFNKNILSVVNNTVETNFSESDFNHIAFFNKKENRIEMHLAAKRKISVSRPGLKDLIEIEKGERIHTENSHKFTTGSIVDYTIGNEFNLKQRYTDENEYFSLCLFEK